MEKENKKLLNIKEAGEYLGVGYHAMKMLIAQYPEVVAFRYGRNILMSKERLDKYINGDEHKAG